MSGLSLCRSLFTHTQNRRSFQEITGGPSRRLESCWHLLMVGEYEPDVGEADMPSDRFYVIVPHISESKNVSQHWYIPQIEHTAASLLPVVTWTMMQFITWHFIDDFYMYTCLFLWMVVKENVKGGCTCRNQFKPPHQLERFVMSELLNACN